MVLVIGSNTVGVDLLNSFIALMNAFQSIAGWGIASILPPENLGVCVCNVYITVKMYNVAQRKCV